MCQEKNQFICESAVKIMIGAPTEIGSKAAIKRASQLADELEKAGVAHWEVNSITIEKETIPTETETEKEEIKVTLELEKEEPVAGEIPIEEPIAEEVPIVEETPVTEEKSEEETTVEIEEKTEEIEE